MALKGVEVVEFIPSPKIAEETLTPPEDNQRLKDTESDLLVSDPVMPVTVLIELFPWVWVES